MARLVQVNPNRMELQRLKKRLVVARRGHKLLKDKQDALIKEFIALARRAWELRTQVEEELIRSLRAFVMARSFSSREAIEQAFVVPMTRVKASVSYHNVMSVHVPRYSFERTEGRPLSYSFAFTSAELDEAVRRFSELLPKLLELAQLEKSLKLMAVEIEKTRRRVNALEYVLIPGFQETIRYITMKLDEMERSNLSRLMRIKEIVRAR